MTNAELTLELNSLEDTDRLGKCIAAHLPDSACIVLSGTLGAGKTTLTQAILSALDIPREEILSPTFALIRSYAVGNRSFHHMDAYRVADDDEFLELGVEELFEAPQTLCVIEWGDRVRDVLPTETLWISIEWQTESSRVVGFTGAQAWASFFRQIGDCFVAIRKS